MSNSARNELKTTLVKNEAGLVRQARVTAEDYSNDHSADLSGLIRQHIDRDWK